MTHTTETIASFIAANPDIDLQTADLFGTKALSTYNWPADADQKQLLQSLRTRQRLLKIYPDEGIASMLEALGYHSAHHITSIDESEFTQKVLPPLASLQSGEDIGSTIKKIYGNAQRIRRTSFEVALASPRTTELTAQSEATGAGTPDYERLFGPIITCDCDECQSIFGPAAYFTDLMRVVTQYVTPPLEKLYTLQYRRPDLWVLPLDCNTAETEVSYLDIVNGILQQNLQTNYTDGGNPLQAIAAMPYPFSAPYNQPLLAIRNSMAALGTSLSQLYTLLEAPAPASAAEMLNLSPEQLSLVTGTDSFSLAQKYGFYNTAVSDEELCDALSVQKEFLKKTGLQPSQLEQLVFQNLKRGEAGYAMYNNGSRDINTESFTQDALAGTITAECWIFPQNIASGFVTVFGKGNMKEFCIGIDQGSDNKKHLVFSYGTSASNESFTSNQYILQNTWTHIAWVRNTVTGSSSVYINGELDTSLITTENLNALTSNTPVSIGYITGSSYSGAISEVRIWATERTAAQIKGNMYTRLKDYTQDGLFAYWPLNETGGDVATDLGPHGYNATNGKSIYFTHYEALPFGGSNEMNPQLLHSLYLNNILANNQYVTISNASIDIDTQTVLPPSLQLTTGATNSTPLGPNSPLSTDVLNQLAVYIRLQAQTGWAFDELDWAIKSVISILNIPDQTTLNNTIIESLGQIAALVKKYNIKVDEACSFWCDMKTYGRGNSTTPQDLWDRVFNTPPLMADSTNSSETDYYRPLYSENKLFVSPIITWTFNDGGDSQNQRLGNQLAAALGISSDDLYAIINSLITASSIQLTVPQLSQLYRIVRLAKMVNMRVPDFIQLSNIANVALTDTKIYWTIDEVADLCEKAEWMKKMRLSIDQLAYLTSDTVPASSLNLATADTMNKAQKDLIQSSAQVLITSSSFINESIDAAASQAIYQQLIDATLIDSNGIVMQNASNLELLKNNFPSSSIATTLEGLGLSEEEVQEIGDWVFGLLLETLGKQEQLAVKSLAAVASISEEVMTGVCWLTSGEVDNSSALGYSTPYPYAVNMLLNPASVPTPDNTTSTTVTLRNTYLSVLQRNTAVARWFRLTGKEAAEVLNYSNLIGKKAIGYGTTNFTISQLILISSYKSVQNLCNKPNGLIEYFRLYVDSTDKSNTPSTEQLQLLAELTGWNYTELDSIVNQAYFSTVNFNTIEGLRKLAIVMAMEEKTGTGISTFNLFCHLSTISLFDNNGGQNWQNYTDASATAMALLSGKSGETAVTQLKANLAEQLRTVYSNWLIWELSADTNGVSNLQELYEYLLIDVNMSGKVKTSFTVAAMNSLQLYVNRCINNLEPGINNNIPESWWEWMSTYRVWQANREVYLYPENYVDPTLRKFKTSQFTQFISDISKGQITDENVKKALATYLQSAAEVSSLELIDGYLDPISDNLPGTAVNNQKNTIFLIGRSNVEPYTFYSRTLVSLTNKDEVSQNIDADAATKIEFGPWEEIGLKINAEYVTTVAAFGRQFIFWVEQNKVVNTASDQQSSSSKGHKYTTIYATVYYSYRDFNNSWIEPAVLQKDIIVQVYGHGLPDLDYYTGCLMGAQMANSSEKTYVYYKKEDWNKVTLQVVPATASNPQSIMAFIGPYVTCDPTVTLPIAKPDYTGMNDEQVQLQTQLYESALFTSSNKGKYATVIPPVLLDAALNSHEFKVSIDTTGASFMAGELIREHSGYGLVFNIDSTLIHSGLYPPSSWWPSYDNDKLVEGTTVVDIISGDDAQISGTISWTPGKYTPIEQASIPDFTNGSIVFDWSDNKSKTQYSFSFWIDLSTTITDNTVIFKAPYSYAQSRSCIIALVYTTGQLQLHYVKGSDGSIYCVNAEIPLGTWCFVTVTTNGNEVEIYLNGVSNRNSIGSDNINSGNSSLYFGNFPGYAFGFQFHNRALSAFEALLLYQSATGSIYLSGLHHSITNIHSVSNSAGIFAFNTGSQAYLVLPNAVNNAISNCITASASGTHTINISYNKSPLAENVLPAMCFVRINTDALQKMVTTLAKTGIAGLYKPTMQYLSEENLDKFYPTELTVLPESNYMNFNGSFEMYFWEIFFYAPYLIAEKLRTSQKYKEAEKWFQYIFDPTNQNSPVAYWPINREVNSKFPDLAGREGATPNYLSGSTQETPRFSSKERNIYTFNGTNSNLTVPYSKALNTPEFTVCAWVNLASIPSSSFYSVVCSQNSTTGYQMGFWVDGSGNWILKIVINSGGTEFVNQQTPAYNLTGKWIFVSATYNGKYLKIFIDGHSQSTQEVIVDDYVLNTLREFTIGSGNSSSPSENYFDGNIAEVMLFNRALSHGELRDMYKDYAQLWINSNFWNFRPFRRINAESLYHILNGDSWQSSFFQPAEYYTASLQMAVYEYDPFDPDSIARLRLNSWQKATFMRYVENLINWGDALFTQDTWETLTDASMRYVLASTLLGRYPVKEVAEEPQPTVNYNAIELEYGEGNVPPFLIETENGLSSIDASTATLPQQVQSIVDAYYCVPTNKQLLQYWDLVADRLYKIRHGLTITGAQNNIPLFAAPINPAALVAAKAGGQTINSAAVSIPLIPAYRFSYMIAQAKAVVGEVTRLGGELLAALEKKDAEQLSQMQAGYQSVVYNLTAQIKASQINQLQYTGQGLQESLSNAQYVEETYEKWMSFPLNFFEVVGMYTAFEGMVAQMIGLDVQGVSVPLFLLPNIFGLADGGMNFGGSTAKAGEVLASIGQLAMTESQLSNQTAQYIRRYEEWELQKNIAANQVKEISAQIEANNYALEAAKQDMVLNQTQLEQSQEVINFLKTKFTNDELYSWMAGQLSTLYSQMFQLAWSLAQSAQTALQYELNISQTYLSSAAWNESYQGLLAGDSLSLALQQMENAYIAGNTRRLEIRKTWSMRQNNPQALLTLIQTGNCNFDLNALSYSLDFPGHYNRKIKSLSITIPAVVGPYQNIHATLTQTGNVVTTKPNLEAVEYLLGNSDTPPTDGSLRVNWNPNQEIAISSGVNDAGVFQVNFNDEQYLPFEGTGAISSWSLSIPQAANAFPLRSISDVIITVEYTAEDAGSAFASQVTALPSLTNYNGWQYLSLRQIFSSAWFSFCENPVDSIYSLSFELVEQMYPDNLLKSSIMLGNSDGEIGLVPVLSSEATETTMPAFYMNDATTAWTNEDNMLPISSSGQQSTVPGKGNPWVLKAENVPADLLNNGKIDQTKLQDIILIIPFSGTLSW